MFMAETEGQIKLLFAGPVGSGKTTAIGSISGVKPLSTDVPFFDNQIANKKTTTVAFDYSTISLRDNEILHVYGLPGQASLDFMGPIIGSGAVGAILLLDGSSSLLLEECVYWINALTKIDSDLKFVIGITKVDTVGWFSMREIRHCAATRNGLPVPIFTVDPRDASQVTQLVRLLLLTI